MQVAFYDTKATTGVLLQGLNEDTNGVQNATGEKVCQPWRCMHFCLCKPCTCTTTQHLRFAKAQSDQCSPQVGQFIHHMATFIGGLAIGAPLAAALCRIRRLASCPYAVSARDASKCLISPFSVQPSGRAGSSRW
jgi:hypothetical protein